MLKRLSSIVITGGSSGIGNEILNYYLKKNFKVINIDIAKSKIKHKNLSFFKCDLSKLEQVKRTVNMIIKNNNQICCLINNARLKSKAKFLKESYKQWEKVIRVNLSSHFLITQEIIKKNKIKNKLTIINVSSVAANLVTSEDCSYHSSKSGLEQMGKYFSYNALKKNVNVYNIRLGLVMQKRYEKTFFNKKNNSYKLKAYHYQNSNEILKVENLAEFIYFLIKVKNNFLNGNTFTLDNGAILCEPFSLITKLK
jgi:NADP-dependent 3-hydroxy acid dehydrogenase YdfG